MARTALFGPASQQNAVAMLDGVAGSFVLSDCQEQDAEVSSETARSWSWSSMMRHHVQVNSDVVIVTPAWGASIEKIKLSAVENDLERFLRHLEQRPTLNADVVDHIIATFQGLRARTAGNHQDHLTCFLSLIALRLRHPDVPAAQMPDMLSDLVEAATAYDIDPESACGVSLSADLARSFFEELLTDRRTGGPLLIDLTVRHAGAELFQAAHLAPPVPPAQGDLWGMTSPGIRIRPHSLKEVAYTPVGLARFIAEQTLAGQQPGSDGSLTIMDPTCGSGSFLVEAIAVLHRNGWTAPVRVIGYDISPAAVASARFAVACACRDAPGFPVEKIIEQRDFLEEAELPYRPDAILMNPPFRSWPDMDIDERKKIRRTLGAAYSGRPDKSMAFVQRAVRITSDKAVISALLPVGVLSGEGATDWRSDISETAPPRLIAALGDHSLFRFATVNVCAVSLDRTRTSTGDDYVQMLWASEKPGAASAALRTLRREGAGQTPVNEVGSAGGTEASWNAYPAPLSEVLLKPNWLPAPGLLSFADREALAALDTRVADLFRVHTGIRAGERQAFILSEESFQALPENERAGFRPIAEKRQIANGEVSPVDFVFADGENIESEAELESRFPTYFVEVLSKWKDQLCARNRAGDRWWRQSEPRNSWRTRTDPRIVSRQWFRNDGFAVDPDGRYAVVQGYAWFPTTRLSKAIRAEPSAGDLLEVLRLYCVLMSSDVFFRVAREYSTNAGGGQIALQQKHVKHVPLPVIPEVVANKPHLIDMILAWGNDFPELQARNAFAIACYGFAAH